MRRKNEFAVARIDNRPASNLINILLTPLYWLDRALSVTFVQWGLYIDRHSASLLVKKYTGVRWQTDGDNGEDDDGNGNVAGFLMDNDDFELTFDKTTMEEI